MFGEKKRVLVFGGTFDPPHHGHVSIVADALDGGLADKALFVPALRPPHKTLMTPACFADRVLMLSKAIDSESGLSDRASISEVEAERPDKLSYTFDTMTVLDARFPESELILLIGADSLMNLHTWHRAPELVENWSILTFPRKGFEAESPSVLNTLRENWLEAIALRLFGTILKFETLDVSSSMIRECFHAGNLEKAARFIAPPVFEHITEKGIYGKD